MSIPKIYMGIPSTDMRHDQQMYALRRIERDYAGKVQLVYPEIRTQRILHDFARNGVVEEFLASDCDILWFLDYDVVPPINILDLVTEHGEKWSLAGASYPVVMHTGPNEEPRITLTAYRMMSNGHLAATETPRQGMEFVDGLATGCMFIRRGVFDLLKKPYFEFKFRQEDRYMTEGEDLGFCKKIHSLGLQFLIDHSMVCRHYKMVDLLDMNNYAVDYANAKLLEYDKIVKSKVEALEQQIRGKMGPQPSRSKLILPQHLKR